jgi:hypothetical protein
VAIEKKGGQQVKARAIYSGQNESAALQLAKENFGNKSRLITENEIRTEKSKEPLQRPRVTARELRLIHAAAERMFGL